MVKLCEIFTSIQGEGPFAGKPSLFIRFSGCNKHCVSCLAKYHEKDSFMMEDGALLTQIRAHKTRDIVLTGGEPTLQWGFIDKLLYQLDMKYSVHLETNGTKHLQRSSVERLASVAMSPKFPSSGNDLSDTMDDIEHWVGVFKALCGRMPIFMKWVIADEVDWAHALELFREFGAMLSAIPIYIQPQVLAPNWEDSFKQVIARALADQPWDPMCDVRFSPRLNSVLWGTERRR